MGNSMGYIMWMTVQIIIEIITRMTARQWSCVILSGVLLFAIIIEVRIHLLERRKNKEEEKATINGKQLNESLHKDLHEDLHKDLHKDLHENSSNEVTQTKKNWILGFILGYIGTSAIALAIGSIILLIITIGVFIFNIPAIILAGAGVLLYGILGGPLTRAPIELSDVVFMPIWSIALIMIGILDILWMRLTTLFHIMYCNHNFVEKKDIKGVCKGIVITGTVFFILSSLGVWFVLTISSQYKYLGEYFEIWHILTLHMVISLIFAICSYFVIRKCEFLKRIDKEE